MDKTKFLRDYGLRLRAQYTDSEGVRHNASDALFKLMQAEGMHPDDLTHHFAGMALADQQRDLLHRVRADLERAHRENTFLKRHVNEGILRAAEKAGEVENRWGKLEELAASRFDEKGGKKRGWRTRVAEECGVTKGAVARWEQGIERIPDFVFDTLEALPPLSAPKPKGQGRAKSPPYVWSREMYLHVSDLLVKQGKTRPYVSKETGIAKGVLLGKFWNAGPDETFLGPIEVHKSGPMSIFELWKVGHDLYPHAHSGKATWRGGVVADCDLERNEIGWNDPADVLTQEQMDKLRARWFKLQETRVIEEEKSALQRLRKKHKKKRRYSPGDKPVEEAIKAAGKDGATMGEIAENDSKLNKHNISSAPSRLQQNLNIFDSGLLRDGETVWVHGAFKADYPKQWEFALNRFGRTPEDQEAAE